MTYLLDTHIWLWMLSAPERLGAATREFLADNSNQLLLSAASSWEIAIKAALGRLALPEAVERYVPDRMRRSGVDGLPVLHVHALRVATLPTLHRDPFDRLLVSQAQVEQLTIVTADPQITAYDVATLRADA